MLKKGVFCFFLASFLFAVTINAGEPPKESMEQTQDGLIVYPNINLSGHAQAVRLQVISDKIIRVIAYPALHQTEFKNLIRVGTVLPKNWTIIKKADRVILKTSALTATVTLSTGAISFADKSGNLFLLQEKQVNGRTLTPAVFEGKRSYGISRVFETTSDDSYYGPGQHQDNIINYKGQQVSLFQNNTEVAVPFLVSSKNKPVGYDPEKNADIILNYSGQKITCSLK